MSRGVYRGAYSVLIDDPDFRALSSRARHTFLTMRWSKECGIACLWLLDRPMLAKRTGYPVDDLVDILHELATSPSSRRPWIYLDDDLCWLRNGLRYDPTTNLANPKHREGVMRTVRALPRSPLVRKFCAYYGLPYPFDTHRKAPRRPPDTPSIIPSPSPSPSPKHESESSRTVSHDTGSTATSGPDTTPADDAGLPILAKAMGITLEEARRRRAAAGARA